jgi:hypothetical protein
MSIMEDNGTEIIRVGTLNAWAFKVAIWIAPLFSVWLVSKVLTHDTEIAVLKMQIAMQSGGKGSESQSVNVGAAEAEMADSAKTWLTTRDVAEREGCDERTVLNCIARGQIVPMPEKDGKSWRISENFRIIPNPAESGGKVAAKLQPECEEATP